MNELIEAFNEYFEVIPVNTPEVRAEIFRLRYDVMCEELQLPGFESRRYPARQETDEYDEGSAHCLLRHRSTGAIAGAVRLILSDPDDPDRPFPTEKHAAHLFDAEKVNLSKLPRQHTGEMSRFVLSKRFRSRQGEDQNELGVGSRGFDRRRRARAGSTDRRYFPHPMLGLMVAVTLMAANHGVTHWYAAMEPILNRLLRRFAVDLTPVGPVIDFHGLRQPHLDPVMGLLRRTYKRRRDVWELVTDKGRLWPAPAV